MKTLIMVLFITFLSTHNILGQNLLLEWQSPDSVYLAFVTLEIFEIQKERIDFNDDGHPEIILEGNDNSIKVYDILTNQLIWEYQFTFNPVFLCFANVTDEISKELVVSSYPEVYMINTSTYEIELVGPQNSRRYVEAYDIDQDGKDELILSYFEEDRVEIWGDGTTNSVNNNRIIPSSSKLNQNFPNPFNLSTKIKYELINSGYVEIKIYDVLGKLVDELVNEFKNNGTYEVVWSRKGLSSGGYFYQLLIDGDIVETKNMILMK